MGSGIRIKQARSLVLVLSSLISLSSCISSKDLGEGIGTGAMNVFFNKNSSIPETKEEIRMIDATGEFYAKKHDFLNAAKRYAMTANYERCEMLYLVFLSEGNTKRADEIYFHLSNDKYKFNNPREVSRKIKTDWNYDVDCGLVDILSKQ